MLENLHGIPGGNLSGGSLPFNVLDRGLSEEELQSLWQSEKRHDVVPADASALTKAYDQAMRQRMGVPMED